MIGYKQETDRTFVIEKYVKMKLKIALYILCCASFVAHSGEVIKGIITNVIDGNTIEISFCDHEKYRVLLLGIDSPEPGQNYSEQAKRLLSKLLYMKSVTILIQGKDRQGTRLGEVLVDGLFFRSPG